MTENEMLDILQTKNNFAIVRRLDDKTLDFVIQILLKLPAEEFKEVSPDAHFDFTDLPIPIEILDKSGTKKQAEFSPEIVSEFESLLRDINTEGKNREYPYVFGAKKGETFYQIKKMDTGESQSCQYDWKWIAEQLIDKNLSDDVIIFHTHPKPIGKPHDTLFNRYPQVLEEMGVKPDGLNLSMADLIVNMKMDEMIDKSGHDMTAQSYVLMHDGQLVGFSTNNGIALEGSQKIQEQNIQDEIELN